MAFYGAVRPLHANRQIGNTFDIEPQDIYLYMNELASLVALEKLTLLEFQKLGAYLCPSLPLATRARHRADAAGEVIYYCQNGLPEVMTGDFVSPGPVSCFVCMRRAFFSPLLFCSSEHPRAIGMIFLSTLQLTSRLYGLGGRELANFPPLIIFICHVNGRSDQVSRRRESFVR